MQLKATDLLNRIRNAKVLTDIAKITKREGNVFIVQRDQAFINRYDLFVASLISEIPKLYGNRIKVEEVKSAPYGVGADGKFRVRVRIVDNNDLVTVVNIQSGKECQIPACDVGTCCDPSTETYHSM